MLFDLPEQFIVSKCFLKTILSSEMIGFALRPGMFSPQEIKEAAVVLDTTDRVSRIFIPDGRAGYESLEITSGILNLTKRVRAGSGVIRLLEHEPLLLTRRVQTLQALSSNRFILGVGTGSPGAQPGKAVSGMLQRLDDLKKAFQEFPQGVEPPEIYVAALKPGIAKRSAGRVYGLLLNFCSPEHAARLTKTVGAEKAEVNFACYLKIFYSSRGDEGAQRLMLQEFLNYDSAPQYHEMFAQDGTARAISKLKENEGWRNGPVEVPNELLRVSLANPESEELHRYVQSFRQAGIAMPVVYPYFPSDEKPDFKLRTVKRILDSL
jgi:alkanesulfonate monooxygenase SsuD/methylene tetrahydromethanopterin reductase-like flavin-dependent oxidoreductase (luciferase family)